jgi:hypothetical protein
MCCLEKHLLEVEINPNIHVHVLRRNHFWDKTFIADISA